MITDPDIVATRSRALDDENWRFHRYLMHATSLSSGRLNLTAARLGERAAACIDCRACAACCRNSVIPLSDEEIAALAAATGQTIEAFREQHVRAVDGEPQAIDATPCPFLDGNLCSVYEHRPAACRDYPYVGGDVRTHAIGIMERAGLCPIIFEAWEGLKDETGFRKLYATPDQP
jgi:Fe-S-cluster containining protein